ncbi:MAG TPA: DUF523 domain-containing protein [Acidimicrobiales bacterium]|nr:DUF523 domain-containing protein [Acidimicrobiales bacterium]
MAERSGPPTPSEGWSPSPTDPGTGPLLVSACLVGVACTYDGTAETSAAVVALGRGRRLVPVCPEAAGGLPTPRARAEVQADGRVLTEEGDDVTDAYRRGAAHAVGLARATGAEGAVLKARSPACGCHEVDDGTFRRRRVPGVGVAAGALLAAGIPVCSEEDVGA